MSGELEGLPAGMRLPELTGLQNRASEGWMPIEVCAEGLWVGANPGSSSFF